MALKREYLIKPDTDWPKKMNQIWTLFSKQDEFLSKCSIEGCTTPHDNIEMHHVKHLNRQVDENGHRIIKGVGKKIVGWQALVAGQKRKQIPLCRKHHHDLHKKQI
jgi:hypothetical protein